MIGGGPQSPRPNFKERRAEAVVEEKIRQKISRFRKLLESLELLTMEEVVEVGPYGKAWLYKLARERDKNGLPFILIATGTRPIYLYPRSCIEDLIQFHNRFKEGQAERRRRQLREGRSKIRARKAGKMIKGEPKKGKD